MLCACSVSCICIDECVVVQFQGSAKSLGLRTLTHSNKFEKCRSEFGQSLTNFQDFVELYSMHLSNLKGTAPPLSSVPLFPCSKSKKFNDDMKYEK